MLHYSICILFLCIRQISAWLYNSFMQIVFSAQYFMQIVFQYSSLSTSYCEYKDAKKRMLNTYSLLKENVCFGVDQHQNLSVANFPIIFSTIKNMQCFHLYYLSSTGIILIGKRENGEIKTCSLKQCLYSKAFILKSEKYYSISL